MTGLTAGLTVPTNLPAAVARLTAAALVLTALLNGAGFFLKRIGVMNPAAYAAYIAEHCDAEVHGHWLGNHCSVWKITATDLPGYQEYDARHLYASEGAEVLLKLAKYGYLAVFLLFSLALIAAGRAPPPDLRHGWPALPLIAALLIGAATTLVQFGPMLTLAGLRSFAFLAVALVGAWLAASRPLNTLAAATALLLAVQFVLVPLEVRYGLPLHKGYAVTPEVNLPSRMAGSFVMANSLGVFSAVGLAFYYAFSERRRYFVWLAAGAFALMLLSRSATGLIGLFALLAWASLKDAQGRRRRWLLAGWSALLAAFLLALPELLMRGDVFQSIIARVDKLQALAASGSVWELLFGRGLGAGANLAITLAGSGLGPTATAGGQPAPWLGSPDSTVITLFAQTGLAGVLAGYGLVVYGMVRDPAARPFYLVLILASLMHTVSELFPVDFLLGVALSRSLCGLAPPILPDSLHGPVAIEQGQQPAVPRPVLIEHVGGGRKQRLLEHCQPLPPVRQVPQVREQAPSMTARQPG